MIILIDLDDRELDGKLDLAEGMPTTKEEVEKTEEELEDTEAYKALRQLFKQVRELPPSLPSICFYTFINAYQGWVK